MNLIHELADELFNGDTEALFDFIEKVIPPTWPADAEVPPAVAAFIRKQAAYRRAIDMHTITARDTTETTITWSCECGWTTIETIDAPDYHTPINDRKADHHREMAEIADGTAMNNLPAGHRYEMFLRRKFSDRTPGQIVVWACWMGGFREIKRWDWSEAGLVEALAWIEANPTTEWKPRDRHDTYRKVEADELSRRVNAI